MNTKKIGKAVLSLAVVAAGCAMAGCDQVQSAVGVAAWYVPYAAVLAFVRCCRTNRRRA